MESHLGLADRPVTTLPSPGLEDKGRMTLTSPRDEISGTPFPKARSIFTGPDDLFAPHGAMTAHLVLVKYNNVLA